MIVLGDFFEIADFDIFENAPVLFARLRIKESTVTVRSAFHWFTLGCWWRARGGFWERILDLGLAKKMWKWCERAKDHFIPAICTHELLFQQVADARVDEEISEKTRVFGIS